MRVFAPRLLLPLLLLTMLAGRPPVSAQSVEGTVRLQPPTTPDARVDDPFAVYIGLEDMQHEATVSGVASDGLGAFEFTLLFDPAVLEIHGAEGGALLNSTGRNFQCLQILDQEQGSFTFGCVSTGQMAGPQGTFTLAQVSFRPIEAGSSLLQLEDVDLGGPLADDIPVNVFGASAVSVTGSPVPPPTQPGPGATSGPAPAATGAPAGATQTPEIGSEPDGTASPSQTALAEAKATEALVEIDPEDDGASATAVALAESPRAENDASSGMDGGSSGSAMLWSAAAVGGVVAVGALGLTLVLWRRNQGL